MTGVAAVVVGIRGGAALASALASVGWADERVLLDPDGCLDGEPLPADVGRARTLTAAGTAEWILLLGEDERVPPALAAAVRAAPGTPAAGWRIPHELRVLGMRLRPRRAPVRLAPRAGAALVLAPSLELGLQTTAGRGPRLEPGLEAARADSLDDAVASLDADARALAALLAQAGVRPAIGGAAWAAAAAGAAVLASGSDRRLGMGRWVAAVLLAYRAVVAFAKLWERQRREIRLA